ncbi:MAG: hypothetical protein H6737_20205 [Alphaproteobacteria bacterium]|nr:hypothetical protein [Alphaproteobacteria bacterium]
MKRLQPRHLVLLAASIAAVVCQATLYWWYIEDSAISMAFARNLAEGWGLVRFPGDERVEGYSNPLWVFLMAGWYLVGVDGFTSAKAMAYVLGAVVTVPATWLIARRAEIGDHWAFAAAWVLALDAQFAIWSACGLENSLFCALLALGCWRTLREADVGGFPWAAVCFFGLALTRPEGIVYAALGGFWALVLEGAGTRRWWRIPVWLAVFWVPFAAYHAVRFDYFAFEFPATYYSKLEDARFDPFAWESRAWRYVRDYGFETGRAFFLPVLLAGALTLRSWRGVTVAGFTLWLGVVLLFPGTPWMRMLGWPDLPAPRTWIALRVVSLALIAGVVPFLALGSKGWRVRVMAWCMALVAIGFALRSTGDWMRGYRWMSLAVVPGSVLFGLGCAEVAGAFARFRETPRWRYAGIAAGLLLFVGGVAPQIGYQIVYQPDVGPFAVKGRVDHYAWAMRQLHIERADIIDHDMGAMLYWGGELGIIRDSKGLIDYPFALHHANAPFIVEYAYEEHPFDLTHAHASSGRAVRRAPRRFQDYVEFPGYGGQKLHTGNFVRKSLFMGPAWTGSPDRSARFADGVVLHGLDVRAPEVQPASWLFLEIGLSTRPRPDAPIRVLAVLVGEGGKVVPLDVPLGLEEWYPVTEWKDGEVFLGRVTLPLGPDVPHGRYGIAVVVIGPDGVLPAEEAGPAGSIDHEPHYARGEAYFPDLVRVMPPEQVKQNASADLRRAVEHGNRLQCEQAEVAWEDARAHYMVSLNWQASVRPGVQNAIATCWALRAERAATREDAVAAIRKAHDWDRVHEVVLRVGSDLADAWFAEGLAAREAGDIEAAYGWFRDTLYADPGRSWARRYSEELRVERLGIK